MCTDETRIGQGKVKVEETNRQIALFALVLILTGWVAAPRINGFIQKSELIAKCHPASYHLEVQEGSGASRPTGP